MVWGMHTNRPAALLLAATWAALAGCVSASAPGANTSTNAPRFDHVVVLVSDPGLRDWLNERFTPAEALETVHLGQGTRGEYYLLLDSFIELLYLENAEEADANTAAFRSEYVTRWAASDASPFAIGLTLDHASVDAAPFDAALYRNEVAGAEYVMAAGNADARSPLVYATGPDRAYRCRDTIEEVELIEDVGRREAVRAYLTHPSGAGRLTRVVLTVPKGVGDSPNARLLARLPQVQVIEGDEHHLLLEFDGGARGESHAFPGSPSVTLQL